MTRRVDITNTSNWKGEGLKVTVGSDSKDLMPGDTMTVHATPEGFPLIKIDESTVGKTEPFYNEEGDQLFPTTVVHMLTRNQIRDLESKALSREIT